jgi:hypothetical protein
MKNSKIQKMSLANIEGQLSPNEMENIMAGSMACGTVGALAVITYAVGGPLWGYVIGNYSGLNGNISRCWNS